MSSLFCTGIRLMVAAKSVELGLKASRPNWEFPKIRVLTIRILLFRVLY